MNFNIKSASILLIFVLLLAACSKEKSDLSIKEGTQEFNINKDDIYQNAEAVTFSTVVRSSGEKPVETEYKGIELKILLSSLGISAKDTGRITFNATDGYRVILDMDEVLEPNNVYLVFERDGELLKSKKKGGSGPYQLVIRTDPFSQRWVKNVDEVVIN
ncbi:hypothetical protein DSECCO2_577020 [anaerobic digester metagenome]|jgi:hypothetical protein